MMDMLTLTEYNPTLGLLGNETTATLLLHLLL